MQYFFILLIILKAQINSEEANIKTETCDSSTGTCKDQKKHYINEQGEEVFIRDKRKILYGQAIKRQNH